MPSVSPEQCHLEVQPVQDRQALITEGVDVFSITSLGKHGTLSGRNLVES